jgi:hypothetical protein
LKYPRIPDRVELNDIGEVLLDGAAQSFLVEALGTGEVFHPDQDGGHQCAHEWLPATIR